MSGRCVGRCRGGACACGVEKDKKLRGQGPGLVNFLWAERKTTSFYLWVRANDAQYSASRAHVYESVWALPAASRRGECKPHRARRTRASRRAQYRRPPATGPQRATAHQPQRAQSAHLALSALTGWREASHRKTTTPKATRLITASGSTVCSISACSGHRPWTLDNG